MPYTPIALQVRSPLLTLSTCVALSGESPAQLLLRVQDGSIRLAFDLRLPNTSARALRIASVSLAHYLEQGRGLRSETPTQVMQEISDLLPTVSPLVIPEIATGKLCQVFCCTHQHVLRLARQKCIRQTRAGHSGPTGAARYERRSVLEFLASRRVTV